MRRWIALATGVAVLVLVNFSIYQREVLLRDGHVVLLELAPVDPRSLMQGDYMALRFQVAREAFDRAGLKNAPRTGHVVVARGDGHVARFVRIDDGTALAATEVRMLYRVRGGQLRFATNAFFFEEGDAGLYATAKYGEFRVGDNGESILVALRDKDLRVLGPGAERSGRLSDPPVAPSGPRSTLPPAG